MKQFKTFCKTFIFFLLLPVAVGAEDFLVPEIGGDATDPEGQVYLYLGDSAFVISTDPEESVLPTSYLTLKAYPNPFNPTTTIAYSVPGRTGVQLNVYNIRGELVENLADGVHEPGDYRAAFDGNRLSSGVYFVSLISPFERKVLKIVLLK